MLYSVSAKGTQGARRSHQIWKKQTSRSHQAKARIRRNQPACCCRSHQAKPLPVKLIALCRQCSSLISIVVVVSVKRAPRARSQKGDR